MNTAKNLARLTLEERIYDANINAIEAGLIKVKDGIHMKLVFDYDDIAESLDEARELFNLVEPTQDFVDELTTYLTRNRRSPTLPMDIKNDYAHFVLVGNYIYEELANLYCNTLEELITIWRNKIPIQI